MCAVNQGRQEWQLKAGEIFALLHVKVKVLQQRKAVASLETQGLKPDGSSGGC